MLRIHGRRNRLVLSDLSAFPASDTSQSFCVTTVLTISRVKLPRTLLFGPSWNKNCERHGDHPEPVESVDDIHRQYHRFLVQT